MGHAIESPQNSNSEYFIVRSKVLENRERIVGIYAVQYIHFCQQLAEHVGLISSNRSSSIALMTAQWMSINVNISTDALPPAKLTVTLESTRDWVTDNRMSQPLYAVQRQHGAFARYECQHHSVFIQRLGGPCRQRSWPATRAASRGARIRPTRKQFGERKLCRRSTRRLCVWWSRPVMLRVWARDQQYWRVAAGQQIYTEPVSRDLRRIGLVFSDSRNKRLCRIQRH